MHVRRSLLRIQKKEICVERAALWSVRGVKKKQQRQSKWATAALSSSHANSRFLDGEDAQRKEEALRQINHSGADRFIDQLRFLWFMCVAEVNMSDFPDTALILPTRLHSCHEQPVVHAFNFNYFVWKMKPIGVIYQLKRWVKRSKVTRLNEALYSINQLFSILYKPSLPVFALGMW